IAGPAFRFARFRPSLRLMTCRRSGRPSPNATRSTTAANRQGYRIGAHLSFGCALFVYGSATGYWLLATSNRNVSQFDDVKLGTSDWGARPRAQSQEPRARSPEPRARVVPF